MFAELRSLGRLLRLLRTPWHRVGLAVVFSSLTLGAAIGLAAVSAWLIARASQQPLILDLTVAVVAVRALGISRGVFRYIDRIFSHDVALRGVEKLQEETYLRLAQAPTEVTIGLRRGDLLARFGTDVDAIGDFVVRAFMPALTAVIAGLGSVALIGVFSPRTAVVLACALVISGTVAPLTAALGAWRSERETVHAKAQVTAAVTNLVDTGDELRVSSRIRTALADLRQGEERLEGALRRAAWPAAFAPAVSTLAMGATVVAALWFGGWEHAHGHLTAVNFAVVVLTPLAVFEAVDALPNAAVQTLHSAAAAHRLEEILFATQTDKPGKEHAHLDQKASLIARDLAVGYPGQDPVVSGLNLQLHPGESMAIIGPSGSGKTTLLATLAGLLPPISGQVLLRNQNTRTLAEGQAAHTVVFTAEDAHLFDTSIMENLRVARGDVTEEEAINALTEAGLAQFLASLPDGVHTRVGQGATTLSGGERRRILLARSLLAPAPLLLIDEPDEHLDEETAQALTRHILSLGSTSTSKRGVIVVTHRISTVANADKVVRLG